MHARLKNELTEDEKCHNVMSWLILEDDNQKSLPLQNTS